MARLRIWTSHEEGIDSKSQQHIPHLLDEALHLPQARQSIAQFQQGPVPSHLGIPCRAGILQIPRRSHLQLMLLGLHSMA